MYYRPKNTVYYRPKNTNTYICNIMGYILYCVGFVCIDAMHATYLQLLNVAYHKFSLNILIM